MTRGNNNHMILCLTTITKNKGAKIMHERIQRWEVENAWKSVCWMRKKMKNSWECEDIVKCDCDVPVLSRDSYKFLLLQK